MARQLGQLCRLLKFRHFQVIETLATTRSMRLAGENLGVSTAAISKSCLEIENILGARLFDRTAGRLVPTPLCTRVMVTGRRIHAELNHLEAELTLLQGSLHGRIRIGFQAPALELRLAGWFAAVKATHPFLTLTLEYGSRPWLISELEAHRFDLILVNVLGLDAQRRLAYRDVYVERCVVAAPEGVFDLSETLDRWPEFADRIWVLPVPGMAMREQFDAILKARGLRYPERLVEFSTPVAISEVRAACHGLSLLPVSMAQDKPRAEPTMQTPPFGEVFSRVGVVWAADIPLSAAAQFVLGVIDGSES